MEQSLKHIFEPIDRAMARLSVNTVFGEPTQEGDVTIIPVAEVSAAFGYGYGSGEDEEQEASGAGGGGGLWGSAKPTGYLKITPDGVVFEPTMNPKIIALAGIAFAAWLVFWVAMVRMAVAKRQQ